MDKRPKRKGSLDSLLPLASELPDINLLPLNSSLTKEPYFGEKMTLVESKKDSDSKKRHRSVGSDIVLNETIKDSSDEGSDK